MPGSPEESVVDGVAIVGLAGRFPRAADVAEFWKNLRDGVEGITFFSDEELLSQGVDPAVLSHPQYVKAKGVLEGVELFDAQFFGYTPREAQQMDPQHRVFLECGWHALENAGYNPETYVGAIGVYAGLSQNSYLLSSMAADPAIVQALGTDKDFLSTRLSYKLNLRGPSIVIQTACSTSLVAVCQACQSLLTFQCDMALAGGVSISVPSRTGYFYQEGSILSPDGHCRPFDAGAQGTVMGNGVGVVLLKRLAEAVQDGDMIHAVIKGMAVNNDGATKMGYTAPSIDGQAEVIALAQALAGVSADEVTYVESHGTGTELGDPIEVAALTEAFRSSTDKKSYCALGSVKSNIGHLDAAAGVAGLIKTVLALKHRELPPSVHFEEPNPNIDFANTPFYVNARLRAWDVKDGSPRRAGVSSFGIGGTNAHVVLEEAATREPSGESRPWQVLMLSARTADALSATSVALSEHLRAQPKLPLADVSYTLQVGRKHFTHRRSVVCQNVGDAAAALETMNALRVSDGIAESADRPVVFMFPGQGTQYVNMGRELYEEEGLFREVVDECAGRLLADAGFDVRGVMYPASGGSRADASERLRQTEVAQAALFVVEYALARLWMSWGIEPQAMIGHSIGEYVAACVSGVLTLEDALRVVAVRGRMMAGAPEGAMLAIPSGEERVGRFLGDGLWLSAVNGPSTCVVSGTRERVEALAGRLRAKGIECQRLHTAGAFHSGLMDGVVEPLTAALRGVRVGRARIPYISNLTGTWIDASDVADPSYWGRHVREAVRFGQGIEVLLEFGARSAPGTAVFLEVGPGHALSALVRQCMVGREPTGAEVVSTLRNAREEGSDGETVARALGRLWVAGVAPDWTAYYAGERRCRVELPTYPFQRQRYWVERQEISARGQPRLPTRRPDVADWFYLPSWKRSLPPPVAGRNGGEDPGRWLVLADRVGVGDRVVRWLRGRGVEAVCVRAGRRFDRLGDGEYTIDAGVPGDYEELLREVSASGGLPAVVMHLWGVTGESGGEEAASLQQLGFYSVLHLAQAFGAVGSSEPLRLGVVTDGVHDVTGQEWLCPPKATVLGPCRVMSQEYPHVVCRNIDVVASRPGGLGDEDIARLVAEVSLEVGEGVVAYRGVDRWVRTYEPVSLAAVDDRSPAPLRDGGVYLITGGLGGIGLTLADYLHRSVHAKLILTSRRGLPPRAQWAAHLADHGEADATSRKIRAVATLEEGGAEVAVLSADVSDEAQMREAVNEACRRFGRIDGVIHAAGVAGGGVMQLKAPEVAAAVLAPKVEGTEVLKRVLQGIDVDFIVLCSSLTSIVGGVGQVDYCGANAYLDAFARWNATRRGLFTVAINWDAWREVGMAVEADTASNIGQMVSGMFPEQGVDVFRRIMAARTPAQVVVSTRPPAEELLRSGKEVVGVAHHQGGLTASGEAKSKMQVHPRPNLPTPFTAPADGPERLICGIWQEWLGLESVGIHDSFFDLGGDSLLAINVVAQINHSFETSLPVAALYEAVTVRLLAEAVAADRAERGEVVDETSVPDERRQRIKRQKQRQQELRMAKRQVRG